MRTTLVALVSCALIVISQGAPAVKRKEESKRCCQPSAPSCTNPCAPAAPAISYLPPPPPPMQMPMPMPMPMDPCCAPGPACGNPCPPAPAPVALPPPPPPPVPLPPPTDCCSPGPSCANPCPAAAPPPLPMGGYDMGFGMGGGCCDPMQVNPCANPCMPAAPPPPASYAPYPGEITMKLQQTWDHDKYVDSTTPAYQILAGNLKTAIQAALASRGMPADVSNIYFREGFVPGNPSRMPVVVAHFMVNGNSDAASLLEAAVTPDGTIGDGLKVYKDSFNAY